MDSRSNKKRPYRVTRNGNEDITSSVLTNTEQQSIQTVKNSPLPCVHAHPFDSRARYGQRFCDMNTQLKIVDNII